MYPLCTCLLCSGECQICFPVMNAATRIPTLHVPSCSENIISVPMTCFEPLSPPVELSVFNQFSDQRVMYQHVVTAVSICVQLCDQQTATLVTLV